MSTISVVVEETDEPQSGTLGVLTPGSRIKEIDTDKLRQSVSKLSEQISGIFADIKKVSEFQLKQVQLSVEISAEGGVALIGTAKAGVKGAITLTFSEPESE